MAPNREARARIGKETISILENGWYINGQGERVDIEEQIRSAIENSSLWTERDLASLKLNPGVDGSPSPSASTAIEVTDETAITACRRISREVDSGEGAREGRNRPVIACLNFASAKNVCGGMLKGSLAQEESLGLSSGLHAVLSKFEEDYYGVNRADPKDGLYHDTLIYSPVVPVFRDDKGELGVLDEPISVDFVTCPAVNKGVVTRRNPEVTADKVNEVMRRRIRNVLAVSAKARASILVLGAWGCGVFMNSPEDMARNFKGTIDREEFKNAFSRIIFAIGRDASKVEVFRRTFGV